ncbi:MAG: rhodanese-like domain-containing protein [Deltaproteobacteria bacterium]|nr:rhodanese-like domain-containing protein [Deltaproteobacteria bacterium]
MNIDELLSKIKPISEKEAQSFMEQRKTEDFQLVDVRQPAEYETGHLPGAQLVPLGLLTMGGGGLDPKKPTIVYCRSGKRSFAAAQWLAGQGFSEIYDIGSNITSWLGIQVAVPFELNLHMIDPKAEFPDVYCMAFAMEEGLQRFYLALENIESRIDLKNIYRKLADFEDLHKDRLAEEYKSEHANVDLKAYLRENPHLIEGGERNAKTIGKYLSELNSKLDIFSFSIGIEAQSMDLYFRMASVSPKPEVRKLLLEMVDEERSHLNFLSKELDALLEENKIDPA